MLNTWSFLYATVTTHKIITKGATETSLRQPHNCRSFSKKKNKNAPLIKIFQKLFTDANFFKSTEKLLLEVHRKNNFRNSNANQMVVICFLFFEVRNCFLGPRWKTQSLFLEGIESVCKVNSNSFHFFVIFGLSSSNC